MPTPSSMSAETRYSADPVFLDLTIQGPLADSEQLRGFLAVAGGELEGLGDVELLDLVERSADELAWAGGARFERAWSRGREVFGQVVSVEDSVGVDDDHALDRVLE